MNNNYLATPINSNSTSTSTRTMYNQLTRQRETIENVYIINSVNEDGTLSMDRANETLEYNGQRYVVSYVGPQRNF